jgi:pimeloyl-ACP methyl ester carboxylesterase
MREFANHIPNSHFVEIADAAHLGPLEQPKATNQAIQEFLERNT